MLKVDLIVLPDGTVRLFGLKDDKVIVTKDLSRKAKTFTAEAYGFSFGDWFVAFDLTEDGTIAVNCYSDNPYTLIDYTEFDGEEWWE